MKSDSKFLFVSLASNKSYWFGCGLILSLFITAQVFAAVKPAVSLVPSHLMMGAIGAELLSSPPPSLPPKVIGTLPQDGQKGVAIDANVVLVFDQDMDVDSFTDDSLQIENMLGEPIEGKLRVTDGNILVFLPKVNLSVNMQYRILLAKTVKSAVGIRVDGYNEWVFETISQVIVEETSVESPTIAEEASPVVEGDGAEAVLPSLAESPTAESSTVIDAKETSLVVDSSIVQDILPSIESLLGPSVVDGGGVSPLVTEPQVALSQLEIEYTLPTKDAIDVGADSGVSVIFANEIDWQTFQLSLQTQAGEVVSGTVEHGPTVITFMPSKPLSANMAYIATLHRRTEQGESFFEPLTWQFTTSPEIVQVATTVKKSRSPASLFVKEIKLLNNAIIPSSVVQKLTLPYVNRHVKPGELHALRDILSRTLYRRGYVNTGIVIPNQKVQDGIVTFELIQGKLSHIRLTGNRQIPRSHINEHITLGAAQPLNYFKLQRSLALLQEDPLIERVTAKLVPRGKLGESELQLDVMEVSPYKVALAIDNYNSPNVGAVGISLFGEHRNLTGLRDQLSGSFVSAIEGGRQQVTLAYDIPVGAGAYNIRFGVNANIFNGKLLGSAPTIQALKRVSASSKVSYDGVVFGLKTVGSLIDKLSMKLALSAGLDKKTIDVMITGTGIDDAFKENNIAGEKNITRIWLGLSWLHRNAARAFSLQGKAIVGIDALGATISDTGETDGAYKALNGQMQGVYFTNTVLEKTVLRIDGQISTQVLASEKFAIGGNGGTRGYRENLLTRDNGYHATFEMHFPIKRLVKQAPKKLSLVPFVDYGRAWQTDYSFSTANIKSVLFGKNSRQIYSAGIGVIWQPKATFTGELFWGKALADLNDPNDTDQEQSLHGKLSYQFF